MASFNRFAVLQIDDDVVEQQKVASKGDKKGKSAKTSHNSADVSKSPNSAASAKKRSRRKKGASQSGDNSAPTDEQLWEEEQRRSTLNDISYEEAMKEAILNSQITYEEEQDARKRNPEPVEDANGRQKGKKKVAKKGRHGITLSLAELQTAEFTNGGIKVAPTPKPRDPSPPALPQRRFDTDIFADSEREAHRLLEAERRRETLERSIRNFSIDAPEVEEPVPDILDAETLRLMLEDRENEIAQLRNKIKSIERERDQLRHYFEISENKTVAQLNNEVEKLSKLNRELNNNLVDTCIKLEQERSRAHEMEKSLAAAGRPVRGGLRYSESEG